MIHRRAVHFTELKVESCVNWISEKGIQRKKRGLSMCHNRNKLFAKYAKKYGFYCFYSE